MTDKKKLSKQQWKDVLTPEQYEICRNKGTEPPFSGEYLNNKKTGTYNCLCCGNALFPSEKKFDSGSGWPSFWGPIDVQSVTTQEDLSMSVVRTEVLCKQCDSHLGHVFEDGPQPTGLRYCINSVSLKLEED
tara:strand:- start:33 stop:428 length:396 start_codon:yes stop_codon:yes gene_type:complete